MKAILLTLVAASSLLAQTCATVSPAAAKSEFDAASIKPAGPFKPGPIWISGGPGSNDPARVTAPRIALANLIQLAYDLVSDQVTSPDWMRDAHDNGFSMSATLPATTTKEEYCGMLRNLLASRFHLTFHRETQPRSAYELIVLPGGPKFKKYQPGAAAAEPGGSGVTTNQDGFAMLSPRSATAVVMGFSPNGLRKLSFRDDMNAFADRLGSDINQSSGMNAAGAPVPRVANKTGLAGFYDIYLQFAGTPSAASQRDAAAGPAAAPDPVDIGPDIFTAVQQQLGLKLQKVKDVPVDVLIVDHADQTPTEN